MARIGSVHVVVLLVEDDPRTRTGLKKAIEKTFPRAVVDDADSVEAAHDLIEQRRRAGVTYDLGLVDFKLPEARGRAVDTSIAIPDLLKHDAVPVIHITAWSEDPGIRKRMASETEATDLPGSRVTLVPKNTHEWVGRVMGLIKPYYSSLISARITSEMEEVLGCCSAAGGQSTAAQARPTLTRACGMEAMITLHRDIIENWTVLNEEARREVKRRFAVVQLDTEPRKLSLYRVVGTSEEDDGTAE